MRTALVPPSGSHGLWQPYQGQHRAASLCYVHRPVDVAVAPHHVENLQERGFVQPHAYHKHLVVNQE